MDINQTIYAEKGGLYEVKMQKSYQNSPKMPCCSSRTYSHNQFKTFGTNTFGAKYCSLKPTQSVASNTDTCNAKYCTHFKYIVRNTELGRSEGLSLTTGQLSYSVRTVLNQNMGSYP